MVVGAAAWIAGRWIATRSELELPSGAAAVRAPIDVSAYKSSPRIARADRLTRIVAMVAARALRALPDRSTVESRSVIVASTLASAHTNEAFERRRVRTGRPVPRDFPYTAPNAAAGELAAALQARGPTLALVGGMDVGLAAIERACRWVHSGASERVIVVAAECPPETGTIAAPPDIEPVECAAAIVLGRHADESSAGATISARWDGSSQAGPTRWGPLLSVGPVAQLVAPWCEGADIEVGCVQETGASLRVKFSW
jgi:hypothetical protein